MPAFYYSIGARYYKCERFTITMEVSCMKTQRRTADEQYQLIMECRSSGLSDYQWCTEHNINPGTFYNPLEEPCPAIEVMLGTVSIKISNDVDPKLLSQILKAVTGTC